MTITYHVNLNGDFVKCEATIRTCPRGPENHLILNNEIKTLDDLWEAFKTAKQGTTPVELTKLDPDTLDGVIRAVLYDTTKTVETRREETLQMLKNSDWNPNAMFPIVESDLFTAEQKNTLFFQAPEEYKTELVSIMFHDKTPKNDDILQKYAPYVNQLLTNITSDENTGEGSILEQVGNTATSDKTLQKFLPATKNLNLWTKRYAEPDLSGWTSNPAASNETIKNVYETMIQTGYKEGILETAYNVYAKVNNQPNNEDNREQLHKYLDTLPTPEPFTEMIQTPIIVGAQNTLRKAEKQTRGLNFTYAHDPGKLSVHDSHAPVNKQLTQELTTLKRLHKKTRNHEEKQEIHTKIIILEARLKESAEYRKQVFLYQILTSKL